MDGLGTLLNPEAAVRANGGCPFGEFLGSETDVRVRAQILTKIDYVARIEPVDYGRPLIDTLEGPVKELRFGPGNSLRLLFSAEQEVDAIVFYGGERKQKGKVSEGLIEEALQLREEWAGGRVGVPIDGDHLRKLISGKRLGWP